MEAAFFVMVGVLIGVPLRDVYRVVLSRLSRPQPQSPRPEEPQRAKPRRLPPRRPRQLRR